MDKKTTCVFIALNPGQAISAPYKVTEPAAHLLDRVCNQLHNQGIVISSAKLFINAMEIENYGYTIDYYRVFGNVFTLLGVPENQKNVQVYIKTVDNKLVKRMVTPECTVRHLKALLPRENWKHRLMLLGNTLESSCKIKDYAMDSFSFVSVAPTLVGGRNGCTPNDVPPLRPGTTTSFVDVSLAGLEKRTLSSDAPFWRTVIPGINISVTCACMGSSELISPHGMSTYKLGATKLQCPVCRNTDVTPTTIGFLRCWFRSHGLKADGTQYTSGWRRIAEEDQYQDFMTDKQAEWVSLAFEVRALNEPVAEEDCTICLDPLFEDVYELECGHSYHEACFSKWVLGCPLCKSLHL